MLKTPFEQLIQCMTENGNHDWVNLLYTAAAKADTHMGLDGRMLFVLKLTDLTASQPEGFAEMVEESLKDDSFTALVQYLRGGKKNFHASSGLLNRLLHTEVSGTYGYLKLPFPALLVTFPVGQLRVKEHANDPILPYLQYRLGADDSTPGYITGMYMYQVLNDWIGICAAATVPGRIDAPLMTIHADINFMGKDHEAKIAEGVSGEDPDCRIVRDLAMKFLLYVNSDGADVQPGASDRPAVVEKLKKAKQPEVRERLQKYLSTLSADEYYDVGRRIKVLKAVKGAEATDRVGTDKAFFYSYRFCVRGHFRNQVCGEGRQDRKLVWIEPHMKGPDQAALVHRDYQVGV